jgi:2-dehydro-3-deoxyphosphogluconate aldolase/(4S)-4-hydroxy-2-oxoglutarate aldolase
VSTSELSITRLRSLLIEARVLAVLTIDQPEDAVPLAEALVDSGVRVVELALRTPRALDALQAIKSAAGALLVGAGTVLTADQAVAARQAGADFALAPGFDASIVERCADIGLPFVPGVATASEIQAAVTRGCRLLKFFPAESLGGMRGLSTLATPFAHLGLSYLPLGGIDLAKAPGYLMEPHVAAVGGSWIATPELIRRRAWDVIREQAAHAVAKLSAVSSAAAASPLKS